MKEFIYLTVQGVLACVLGWIKIYEDLNLVPEKFVQVGILLGIGVYILSYKTAGEIYK